MDNKTKKKAGTFQLNKTEAIHGWYSYVEGYSSCLVVNELDQLANENIRTIYDPFGGTGTTPLVAVQRGIHAYYSESNPFMLGVIDAKINSVKRLLDSGVGTTFLREFRNQISTYNAQLSLTPPVWDGFEKFFDATALTEILHIKEKISKIHINLSVFLNCTAEKMKKMKDFSYKPNSENKKAYDKVYAEYKELSEYFAKRSKK